MVSTSSGREMSRPRTSTPMAGDNLWVVKDVLAATDMGAFLPRIWLEIRPRAAPVEGAFYSSATTSSRFTNFVGRMRKDGT